MVLYESGLSIASASISPTGAHIAIGGRDVLKVLSLSTTSSSSSSVNDNADSVSSSLSLHEHRSLRSSTGRKTKLDLVTSDVRWHPLLPRILATASTNGAILSWDLERPSFGSGQAPVTLFRHGRTVNRLAWSPVAPTLLISAGQDGVCRLWDMRCSGGAIEFPHRIAALRARALSTAESQARQWCRQLLQPPLQQPYDSQPVLGSPMIEFEARSESVRDVQFDPFSPLSFASACEDGSVQVWDMRKPHEPLRRFTAHAGLVLVLQFHPSQRGVLATGGRDRVVKIWDLENSTVSSTSSAINNNNINNTGKSHRNDGPPSNMMALRSGIGGGGGEIQKRDWLSAVSPSSSSSSSSSSLSSTVSTSASDGLIATIQTTASVAKLCWRQTSHPWEPLTSTTSGGDSSSSVVGDLYTEFDIKDEEARDEEEVEDAASYRRTSSNLEEHRRFLEALGPYRADASVPYQLATCAALLDNLCYVWDVRNRHLPVATFGGHSDVVTCLSWIDAPSCITSNNRNHTNTDENDDEDSCLSLPNRSRPWLLSASKDGRLRIHDPQLAERPQLSLPSSSLALSALCMASYHKPIARGSFWDAPSQKMIRGMTDSARRLLLNPSKTSTTTSTTTMKNAGQLQILTTRASVALVDPPAHVIQHLANHYKTEGMAVSDLCAHNANVAGQMKQHDVEKAWRTIGALYAAAPAPIVKVDDKEKEATDVSVDENVKNAMEMKRKKKAKNKEYVKGENDEEIVEEEEEKDFLTNKEAIDGNAYVGGKGKGGGVQIDIESVIYSTDGGVTTSTPPGFVIGLLEALSAVNPDGELAARGMLSVGVRSGISSSSSTITTKTIAAAAASSSFSVLPNVKSSLSATNQSPSLLLLPPRPPSTTTTTTTTTSIPTLINKRPSELALAAIPCEFGAPLRRLHNIASSTTASSLSSSLSSSSSSSSFTLSSQQHYQNLLEKDFCALRERVALELVRFYANRGDVQTSVTIARVLSPGLEEKLGKRVLQKLNVQYIDLLHRLSLWSAASTIMSHCSDEGIRRINQQSTSVLISCGMCGKDVDDAQVPQALVGQEKVGGSTNSVEKNSGDKSIMSSNLTSTGAVSIANNTSNGSNSLMSTLLPKAAIQASANPRCRACKHIVSRCSICQEPVRGLYTWCQGCGHGGDRTHMMEWFQTMGQTSCPTGCGHFCTIKELE